jgi:multifunctional beta-oxidation protein
MSNFDNTSESSSDFSDPEDPELVVQAKALSVTDDYTYDEKDCILYNVGIGATHEDLKWSFEGDQEFEVLPTFGVIPQFKNSSGLSRE